MNRALSLYSENAISLNRAAELSGMSPEGFKQLLEDAGVSRPGGFLSEDARERKLADF